MSRVSDANTLYGCSLHRMKQNPDLLMTPVVRHCEPMGISTCSSRTYPQKECRIPCQPKSFKACTKAGWRDQSPHLELVPPSCPIDAHLLLTLPGAPSPPPTSSSLPNEAPTLHRQERRRPLRQVVRHPASPRGILPWIATPSVRASTAPPLGERRHRRLRGVSPPAESILRMMRPLSWCQRPLPPRRGSLRRFTTVSSTGAVR